MLKEYYKLTKPGIVYGNAFTTIAAFLFASRWHLHPIVFGAAVLGIALVIASGCVFNNYLDRDIDRKMERTRMRALVTGRISARSAIIFAALLGVIGLALLYALVNPLTAALALFGFISYVFIYSFAKRATEWGALIGTVPGAIPLVVGYTAVTNQLDLTALVLFVILALWQLPHFYAISLYRYDEYVAADIPILPARQGVFTTKIHLVIGIALYAIATLVLAQAAHLGYSYLVVSFVIGAAWLLQGIRGFGAVDLPVWARRTFLFSLVALMVFSISIAVGPLLP